MSVSSWRLETVRNDRSRTVIPSVDIRGAFVINAEKGLTRPTLVNPKQEQRLIDLFGRYNADYPHLWDVIEYNKIAPVWVSAPYASTDTRGGAVVTANGTDSFSSDGLTDSDIDTYTFSGDPGVDYFLLLNRSPQKYDDIAVQVTSNLIREGDEDELLVFTINVYKKVNKLYNFMASYDVGLDPDGVDGFGKNIYIEDVLEDNDYLKVVVNKDLDPLPTSFSDDTEVHDLVGNTRTDADVTALVDGWDYFKKPRQYSAKLFVDITKDPGIPAIFNTLRNNYQKYSDYILPLPMGEDVADAITTKQDYGINNDGLKFYWNHGKVRNSRFGSNFWSPLTGRVAYKFAQMQDIFNGLAPAWIDENNHGGQLGPGIIEMEFDPSETELEQMDDEGINAIIFDPSYGVMITSQRTGQTPSYLSDTSWIAHSRLFDYLIENIESQVLVQQIVKLNDTSHRQRAASLGNTIVAPVSAEGLLYDYEIVCDETNNTQEMLAQRYFVYDLIVQVTPFSERIRFNFVNLNQTTTVQAFLGA